MAEPVRDLTASERSALEQTARSRTASHGLVTRARIVLDCADSGLATAARRNDVTAATATKWWDRFTGSGVAGLADTPRSGRPSTSVQDVSTVLRYALREPPAEAKRWSTRSIAHDSGLSQATVSRIRRRSFPQPEQGALVADTTTSILTYLDVGPDGCAMAFQRTHDARSAATPAGLLDSVETIACAALLRRPHDGYDRDDRRPRAAKLLRRAADRLPAVPPPTLLIDVPLDDAARLWSAQHPEMVVHVLSPESWLAAVQRIAQTLDSRQSAELRAVQQQVWTARTQGRDEFCWVRPPAHGMPSDDVPVPSPAAPVPSDVDTAVIALCASISGGGLRPGEEISARTLARRAGMSTGRTADALHTLAVEGLLVDRGGRLCVPTPSSRDVIETYTARGLLGTAIARRLAADESELSPAVDDYLAQLEVCDQMNLMHDAHMIDLDFQNELARSAAMPRIGWMFVQLSLQLRLFVTVLGLDYRYPTDEIIADGARLIAACREHDADAAVAAWRRKTDNCVRHMLEYLEG